MQGSRQIWVQIELREDVFKFVGEYGQAGLIDEISRFILENLPQQQDWILAKLQEDAGIQGIDQLVV